MAERGEAKPRSVVNERIVAPDFQAMTDVVERKAAFIAFFAPLADQANDGILATRERLLAIAAAMDAGKAPADAAQREFLQTVAADYGVAVPKVEDRAFLTELLRRVDEVPVSLVVAQAAIESGWGTSRFAREGSNFFGMQTSADAGLVPQERAAGESFKMAVYADARDAVRAYLRTLNTDARYEDMRALREQLRKAGGPMTGEKLAEGLRQYSTRGEAYVADVKAVIASGNLARLDGT